MRTVLSVIVKRLLQGALTIFLVSLLIFFAMELQPGEIAFAILGPEATPSAVEAFNQRLGLDAPAIQRYLQWVMGFFSGDLGQSFVSENNISTMIGARLGNSLKLALLAAIISVPLAIFLGVLTALYRGSLLDRIVNLSALSTVSAPEFVVGYILIVVVAVKLAWLPSLSQIHPDDGALTFLYKAMLPALTLTLVITGYMMRMTRAAILGAMNSPFVEMAKLKGLRPWRIIVQHVLPNVWAPIANVVALNLAYLLVGVVTVEVVFAYPGLGQLLVDSVAKRDVPLVQATTLIFATTYVGLNVLADLVAILTNPRLLYPR